MRVGYYQFCPRYGDPEANRRKVVRRLEEANADLIVLPELAFTGYLFESRKEARALAEEPADSPIVAELAALCRRRRFHVVTGFAERARDKIFNSALLIGPRGLLRTYRKLHLFNEESRWFDPGGLPLEVVRVRGVRVGMMVCFDWVFPEVTRTLALQRMELLCHPSNLVLGHCQQAMLTRCLENGIYAVTANRFGEDRRPGGSVRFTGRSQVAGPRGERIHRGPGQREELHICEIDPARTRDKLITAHNDLLSDRRPVFYAGLEAVRRRR